MDDADGDVGVGVGADERVTSPDGSGADPGEPDGSARMPVMPAPPPFPTFESRPHVPHQAAGGSSGERGDADG